MADQDDRRARGTIDRSAVVLGVLGGFFLDPVVALVLAYGLARVLGPGFGDSPWWLVTFVALPVGCVPFLLSPRTRQAGAGLLIGVALGSIVFGGSCLGVLALLTTQMG